MRPNIQKPMQMYTIPIKIWQKSSGWNLKENTFKQGERNCKSEGGNLSLEIQQEDKVTEKNINTEILSEQWFLLHGMKRGLVSGIAQKGHQIVPVQVKKIPVCKL